MKEVNKMSSDKEEVVFQCSDDECGTELTVTKLPKGGMAAAEKIQASCCCGEEMIKCDREDLAMSIVRAFV